MTDSEFLRRLAAPIGNEFSQFSTSGQFQFARAIRIHRTQWQPLFLEKRCLFTSWPHAG